MDILFFLKMLPSIELELVLSYLRIIDCSINLINLTLSLTVRWGNKNGLILKLILF